MRKMIEWVEPWHSMDCVESVLYMRMTEEDTIRAQRSDVLRTHGWCYLSDEDALEDFITVRWAQRIEVFE